MSNPIDETKFSIFKPFSNFEYTDTLFRNQPEGMRLTATYTLPEVQGERVTRTGYYTLEDRQWVLKRGYDVVGLFYAEGDETADYNGQYYADEVADAFCTQIDSGNDSALSMTVNFTPAPVKKNGAPF